METDGCAFWHQRCVVESAARLHQRPTEHPVQERSASGQIAAAQDAPDADPRQEITEKIDALCGGRTDHFAGARSLLAQLAGIARFDRRARP
jgi:hypothetical protein